MNINTILQQVTNMIVNSPNVKPATDVSAQSQGTVADANISGTETQSQTQNVRLPDQDAVNNLLKELSDKFSVSQKAIDNMPESMKNEIRQLLSQKATLFDMGSGLSNLVQGQKDIYSNLSKLADTLMNIAKFISEAEQVAEPKLPQPLPDSKEYIPVNKEALLEKLDSQLLKQLLDGINTRAAEIENKQSQSQNQPKLPEPPAGKETMPLPEKGKLPEMPSDKQSTVINRETANAGTQTNQQAQTNSDKQVLDFLRSLVEEFENPGKQPAQADEKNQMPKDTQTKEQPPVQQQSNEQQVKAQTKEQLLKDLPQQTKGETKEQVVKQQTTAETNNFFKNATVVKGLAEALSKENLGELMKTIKDMNVKTPEAQNTKNAEQTAKTTESAATPKEMPKTESNSLLQLAKQSLPASLQESANVTTRQIENLFNNLQTLAQLLNKAGNNNAQMARALQTLSNNPAMLSIDDKAELQAFIAKLIKDVFKGKGDLSVLEKALGKISGKDGMFLDKELNDLQAFNKLLKNAESLQHSRQQVENWSQSLRDLATGIAKTSGFTGEKSSEHIQSSFVFNLATDGQEKNNPVYIHIYHEKGSDADGKGRSPETWLRVKVDPEYVGEVTAIFHLYQENLLDVKVVFANPDGMNEFNRFLPGLQDALQNTNMHLNSIMVV